MNFNELSKQIQTIQDNNKSQIDFDNRVKKARALYQPIEFSTFYFTTTWRDVVNMESIARSKDTVVRCYLVCSDKPYSLRSFTDDEILKVDTNKRDLKICIDKPHIYNNIISTKPTEGVCPCCGDKIVRGGILECTNSQCVLGAFFNILYSSYTGLKENDAKTLNYLVNTIGDYYKQYHPEWYLMYMQLNKVTRMLNKIEEVIKDTQEAQNARYEYWKKCKPYNDEADFESYHKSNQTYHGWDKAKADRYNIWRNKKLNSLAFRRNFEFHYIEGNA